MEKACSVDRKTPFQFFFSLDLCFPFPQEKETWLRLHGEFSSPFREEHILPPFPPPAEKEIGKRPLTAGSHRMCLFFFLPSARSDASTELSFSLFYHYHSGEGTKNVSPSFARGPLAATSGTLPPPPFLLKKEPLPFSFPNGARIESLPSVRENFPE